MVADSEKIALTDYVQRTLGMPAEWRAAHMPGVRSRIMAVVDLSRGRLPWADSNPGFFGGGWWTHAQLVVATLESEKDAKRELARPKIDPKPKIDLKGSLYELEGKKPPAGVDIDSPAGIGTVAGFSAKKAGEDLGKKVKDAVDSAAKVATWLPVALGLVLVVALWSKVR